MYLMAARKKNPETGRKLEEARARAQHPSLAAALDELQRLCAEENYEFSVPPRINRQMPRPGRRL
jgi:hypothetical protein